MSKAEEFEQEWKRYCDSKGGGAVTMNIKDVAQHFAEWQREQMMKGVIEGKVNSELGSAITTNNKGTILTERFNLGNLHIGDKVKVIIIKE